MARFIPSLPRGWYQGDARLRDPIALFQLLVAGWLLIGVFRASHEWLFARGTSQALPWLVLAAAWAIISCTWALLTLVIFHVVHRLPFRAIERWTVLLGVFLPLCIGVSIVAVYGKYLAYTLFAVTRARLTDSFLIHEYHPALLDAFIVLGVACAIRIRNEAASRQLQAAQLETAVAEAQINELRSQMQPHFLFNALQAVAATVHSSPDVAEAMIVRLSDLLRVAMQYTGRQLVSLRDECEFARSYLAVQQIRFGDQLRVRWQVDPAVLDRLVPNLVVQPLLENCFKHGAAPPDGCLTIVIDAQQEGDRVVLRVENNSVDGRRADRPNDSGGIGLTNLMARLAVLYGSTASLRINRPSDDGNLTVATVVIPPSVIDAPAPREEIPSWSCRKKKKRSKAVNTAL